jgi:2-polyprenyl-3-methyl-5-hydroxy-6-metoxy-1,4-benzoquinol methylase
MEYIGKSGQYFGHERNEMLAFLPTNAKHVLEVGCGRGVFAAAIKKKTGAEIWGIELVEKEAEIAKMVIDNVFVGPCEDHINMLPEGYFDVAYFNDVLEHLVDPYVVLAIIKDKLKSGGIVISSIPNMRFHKVLKNLVLHGDWEYKDDGILDRTHLRWFTKKSIRNMYENLGFTVEEHVGISRTRSLKPILYNIPMLFTGMDMRFQQFATVARKTV